MSVWETIHSQGVVAIVRARTPEDAAQNVRALVRAGLRAIEVSLVTPDALQVVADAARQVPDGVHLGVGTVLSAAEVADAAAAGAQFIVSPVFDPSVVQAARDAGMEVLPGVATPTEAFAAVTAGARAVKLFPASVWSPRALQDMRASMPWLLTVPTGGVSIQSAPEWIRAGATAVGVGSTLTSTDDPTGTAQQLLHAIAEARRSR